MQFPDFLSEMSTENVAKFVINENVSRILIKYTLRVVTCEKHYEIEGKVQTEDCMEGNVSCFSKIYTKLRTVTSHNVSRVLCRYY